MASNRVKVLKLFFVLFFALGVFIGKSINFSKIVGTENQFFTLYQLIGPIVGRFLGPKVGMVAVMIAQSTDLIIKGKPITWLNLLRFLPMLLATYYFGTKKKFSSAIITLICIALFNIHPVGRQAWPYSMYWWIPVFSRFVPDRSRYKMVFQSFGATFTAHAVGSVIWLYTVPMEPAQWLALIPVVAFERFIFGLGILGSYYGTQWLLKKVAAMIPVAEVIRVEIKEPEPQAVAVEVEE